MAKCKRHLIIDCDPGCDDALALALLLRDRRYSSIDVLTVAGNVCVEQTTANACRVLSACRALADNDEPRPKDVCIYRGCSRSLTGDEPSADSVHGRDGLGDVPNALLGAQANSFEMAMEHSRHTAVEHLGRFGRDGREVDLLCTGPLTNIATTITLATDQKSFWSRFNTVVVLGGSFGAGGNITPSAEFNMFYDPLAAQIVLDSWRVAHPKPKGPADYMHFVPLDATERVSLDLNELEEPEGVCRYSPSASSDRAVREERGVSANQQQSTLTFGEFLFCALQQYGLFHVFACHQSRSAHRRQANDYVKAQLLGSSGVSKLSKFCFLHDPLAAWVLLDELHKKPDAWDRRGIRINTGRGMERGRIIETSSKARSFGAAPGLKLGTAVRVLKPIRKDRFLRRVWEIVPTRTRNRPRARTVTKTGQK